VPAEAPTAVGAEGFGAALQSTLQVSAGRRDRVRRKPLRLEALGRLDPWRFRRSPCGGL